MNDDVRAWSRVKQLLESALERAPEERPAFLDRACEGDDDLRRDVESLLAAHDAAGTFGERPAIQALADQSTEHPAGDLEDGLAARLKPGDDLGPYRIAEYLGAGGMGEVYRATDTRLHRSVALKILPHELGDRRQRFEREAGAVAALRHPHICVLHDIGEADGVVFLVMEFLDGESLAARLTRGPLPLQQALRYGIEIADALAETHRQGIVHRDLKPGNIMLTAAGATLLDFGIAKRQPPVARGESFDASDLLTAPSAILGTLHYSAPEQLEGKAVDARTDLFGFGAVLYEMVAGTKAFDGASQAGVVAAILERQPAPLNPERQVPIGLERLILKCLAKPPGERWQRSGDVVDELRRLSRDVAGVRSVKAVPSFRSIRVASFVALLVVVIGSAVLWRTGLGARILTRQQTRSQAGQPNAGSGAPPLSLGNLRQLTSEEGLQIDPSISPDGKFVAYAGGNESETRVLVRFSAGGRALRLTDAVRALEYQPRWSPDGTQILYVTGHGAFVASAFGGMERRMDSASDSVGAYSSMLGAFRSKLGIGIRVSGATWSPDGRHIALAYGGSLSVVPLDASDNRRVVAESADELHQCEWSPDGRWIACAAGNANVPGSWAEHFGNLAPSAIVLVPAAGGSLVQIADRSAQNQSPAWSRDGTHLYFVSNRQGGADIYSVAISPDGHVLDVPVRVTTGLGVHSMALSADRKHLAYAAYSARANIWSLPIPAYGPVNISAAQPVTSGNQVVEAMNVSRDGKWLLYDSTLHGNADIFRIPIAGGPIEQLTTHPAPDFAPDLSPDGSLVAFHSWRTGTRDIFVKPIDGGPEIQVTGTPGQESYPFWAADGRSLTFFDQTVQNGVARGTFSVRRDDNGLWGAPVPLDVPAGSGARILSGGHMLAVLPDHIEITSAESRDRRVLYQAMPHSSDPIVDWVQTDQAEKTLYFKSHDTQGRATLWSLPISGGRPRLLVRFDDPTRPSTRQDFAVANGRFYFAINTRQSNIWIADITER